MNASMVTRLRGLLAAAISLALLQGALGAPLPEGGPDNASVSVGNATERDVGKVKTAWIEWSHATSFFSGPANTSSQGDARFVTVCVLGRRTRVCPFTHALDAHTTSSPIDKTDAPSSTDVVMSYRVDPRGDALHVSLLEGDATAETLAELGDFDL